MAVARGMFGGDEGDSKVDTQRMNADRKVHESIRPTMYWKSLEVDSLCFRPYSRERGGFARISEDPATFALMGGACKTENQAMEMPNLHAQGGGFAWSSLKASMPVAVHSHATVVLGSRSVVIFGGSVNGQLSNMTYVYDPVAKAWSTPTPLTQELPEPRKDMAACAVNRRLMIHGGWSDDREPLSPTSPMSGKDPRSPRGKQDLAALEKKRDAYCIVEDTFSCDVGARGVTWHRASSAKFLPRHGHTMVAWEDRVIMFGGFGPDGATNSTHIMLAEPNSSWLDIDNEGLKGSIPKQRAYHTATVVDAYMVICGGEDEAGALLHDVSTLHLPSMTWTKPNTPQLSTDFPPPRSHHGAARNGINDILIFGGKTAKPSDVVHILKIEPPPAKIPQEIFQEMLSSLLERMQRNIDTVTKLEQGKVAALEGKMAEYKAHVTDAETMVKGLQEQLQLQREQRGKLEEQLKGQADLVREMELHTDGAKKQATDSVTRTELELQRLQRKVKRMLGPTATSGQSGLLPAADLQLVLDDEHVVEWETSAAVFRTSPAYFRNAYMGVDMIMAESDQKWDDALGYELRVVMALRHPYLMDTYGVVMTDEGIVHLQDSIFETWADMLEEEIADDEKIAVAIEVATALEFLHSRGVAHTNISLESIYVKSFDPFSVKLGRLLTSRTVCRANRVPLLPSVYNPGPEDLAGARKAVSAAGERIDPRKGDISALGIFLCALYIQEEPDTTSRVSQIDRISNPSVQMVVMACLDKDARHRPSAQMVCSALAAIRDGNMPELKRIENDTSVSAPLVDVDADD